MGTESLMRARNAGRAAVTVVPMRRRWLSAVAAALVFVAAACSGGDDSSAKPAATRSTTTTTPSTSEPASTTTTVAGNLDAARVKLTQVAPLTGAIALAVRTGDPALYVATQTGRVVAIRDGQVDPTPVLNLGNRVISGGEQGLLGLAFSADGTKLYVDYTAANSDTHVEEYAFADGRADPGSRRLVLSIADPQPNHNGGNVVFGPDGYLYLGFGDGGAGGDTGAGHAPGGNGQSLGTLWGKLLRIDPTAGLAQQYTIPAGNPFESGGGRPEIWAYGLRNPWRFSFDRDTGDLWIADVGQGAYEEIDFMPAGQGAGANYGWNRLEGTHKYQGTAPADAVAPVLDLPHTDGYCAVVGGYVYRGTKIPDLRGAYLFGDNCRPPIRAIRVDGGKVVADRDLGISLEALSSFGQDASGDLYLLSLTRGVFRLDPA